MSAWTGRVLREFPADLSRFWIARDPDEILLDERVLGCLRERGFEVMPFEDPVAFRTEYEERYRAAWDRGEEGPSKALVLQLRGTDLSALPWDYACSARVADLSLADLFPGLDPGVVGQVGAEHREELFRACREQGGRPLGERATKELVLARVYRFDPRALESPADFWREILRLHYRGSAPPRPLAAHAAAILGNAPAGDLPVERLLSSRDYAIRVVQDAWARFLSRQGIRGEGIAGGGAPRALPKASIPFEDPDVRPVMAAMFLDGVLRPVSAPGPRAGLPDWIRAGLAGDPGAPGAMVARGVEKAAAGLPGAGATHRDWVEAARRMGEVISRFNGLSAPLAEPIGPGMRALRREADERLRDWLSRNYASLPSLPAARGPAMVHHVPRHLALRRRAGADRVALVVFDGMAMDQWAQIREHLADRVPGFSADESGCFAWLPTLTSVSRQALFSGLRPREFAASIGTTSREPALWARFWGEQGLSPPEVFFGKGLKRTGQLAGLGEEISRPSRKAAGLVVDMIDEIVHGATLGKRGIAGQVKAWCETGFVEGLLLLLADHGYQIYVTADHGNVDAEGIGRLSQGAVSELKGERARAYRSEGLAASVPPGLDVFRLDSAGLPAGFIPVYAGKRGAFVPKGDQVVAHGGASIEEIIVPFARITMSRAEP